MSLGKGENDDMIDFFKELRLALMETCVCIVHGYHQGNVMHEFQPHIIRILEYIQKSCLECPADSELFKIVIGLLGDIPSLYIDQQVKMVLISGTWINDIINIGKNFALTYSDPDSYNQVINYAISKLSLINK